MIPIIPLRRDVAVAVLVSAGVHFGLALYSKDRAKIEPTARTVVVDADPPIIEITPRESQSDAQEIPHDTNPMPRAVDVVETDNANPFKMPPETYVPTVPGIHNVIPVQMGPIGPAMGPVVFEMKSLDRQPVAKHRVAPNYPFEERRGNRSGQVLVDFIVDASGKVYGAHAVDGDEGNFPSAAVAAVSRWTFQPGMKNGRPVATHMQIPIVFTLNTEM